MSRAPTRQQMLENAAFIAALHRTGNAREAARMLGVHRGTYTKRRAKDPVFATQWDAALIAADARLRPIAGKAGPKGPAATPQDADPDTPRIIRTRAGRLQFRRTAPGGLTRKAEQAFLAALSATANVRLSAAAAGFAHSTFYARRDASPAFAREMRLALQEGYARLEAALIAGFAPESYADDGWRHNDPPPIPAMTANQALQLLHLHQKEARLLAEPAHMKRRRGESSDAYSYRLSVMSELRLERDREAYALAEAARRAGRSAEGTGSATPDLPALDQVTGWSKADPKKPPHDPGVALFGGWRLKR